MMVATGRPPVRSLHILLLLNMRIKGYGVECDIMCSSRAYIVRFDIAMLLSREQEL